MDYAPDPCRNRLLAALLPSDLAPWLPHLEAVDLALGQRLCEPSITPTYAYFPITAIVSLLYVSENGQSAEVAVVGNEGVVGVPLFMGGGSTPSCAVVQSAGQGVRLKGALLRDGFASAGSVKRVLLRYTQALITQMAQTAACNRHHTVDQQLCRWLLLRLDRVEGNELRMTHELLASLLGVRREGVTDSALKLQKAGVISYARGHITVIDRQGLERGACECYRVIRREYDRLLPAAPRAPDRPRKSSMGAARPQSDGVGIEG